MTRRPTTLENVAELVLQDQLLLPPMIMPSSLFSLPSVPQSTSNTTGNNDNDLQRSTMSTEYVVSILQEALSIVESDDMDGSWWTGTGCDDDYQEEEEDQHSRYDGSSRKEDPPQ